MGIAYQFGREIKSRLGYYNAPNPDPTYYRYLPSFYLNSSIGANFRNAALAKEGFLSHPQLRWTDLFDANVAEKLDGKAAYILYDDTVERQVFSLSSSSKLKLSNALELNIGLSLRKLNSKNYARIRDLLGAQFHLDVDPFSNTLNDLNGNSEKGTDAVFNYNYNIRASQVKGFTQLRISKNKWNAFFSGVYSSISYLRKGLFLNERYLESSVGESEVLQFSNFGIKGGFTRKISGRHWITTNGVLLTRAPFYQNSYINPREHNGSVSNIKNEKISSVEVNYNVRLPQLTGRLSGFYTRFQGGTDVNFFFVDSGIGSEFVQEVQTGLDKLHMGIELGVKYQISSFGEFILGRFFGEISFCK